MTTTKSPPLSLAILDDYFALATPLFESLNVPILTIHSYTNTLDASKPADLSALVECLKPYDIISSMRERTAFPAALLTQLPKLKLLLNSGARNASIDLVCAKERGIVVTGTLGDIPADPSERLAELPPPKGRSTVIQHAWAQVLALASRIGADARAWEARSDAWQTGCMVSLYGKTLGIVGAGKLGTGMAKFGVLAFGMTVIAWSENLTQEKADEAAIGAGLPKGTFQAVGKEELFRAADVLSLHLVLSDRSRGVVGAEELSWMKPSAILSNTSRAGLIDESALVHVLKTGRIGGACLDVFWEEPLPKDSIWRRTSEWSQNEVVASPHMGYVNKGTMGRWYQEQAAEVQRWVKGEAVRTPMGG